MWKDVQPKIENIDVENDRFELRVGPESISVGIGELQALIDGTNALERLKGNIAVDLAMQGISAADTVAVKTAVERKLYKYFG